MQYLTAQNPKNAWLYPSKEVYELERYYDDELGPHSRKVFYYYMFHTAKGQKVLPELFARHYEYKYEYKLSQLLQPYTIILMTKKLDLTEAEAKKSIEIVKSVWERTNAMLSDGRQYLLNNTFTAADIAFASLAYGLVLPPEMEHIRYSFEFATEALPPELYTLTKECRNSLAGQVDLAKKIFVTKLIRSFSTS